MLFGSYIHYLKDFLNKPIDFFLIFSYINNVRYLKESEVKMFRVTVVFKDDSSNSYSCETAEDVQKAIKETYIQYDSSYVKIIQVLNMGILMELMEGEE